MPTEQNQTRLAIATRLYLASRNIDQKTLAAKIGCSQATITRFLAGTGMPTAPTVLSIFTWLMENDDAD